VKIEELVVNSENYEKNEKNSEIAPQKKKATFIRYCQVSNTLLVDK